MIKREIRSAVVTGPTGAIGMALCNLLERQGVHVFAVVRPGSRRLKHLKQLRDYLRRRQEHFGQIHIDLVRQHEKSDHVRSKPCEKMTEKTTMPGKEHEQGCCLDIIECDMSEYHQLPTVLRDSMQDMGFSHIDAFFHLAWGKTTGSGRNDMAAQLDNVRYTLYAVEAAKDLGCSVFLGAGSQAEYGRVDHALTDDTPCFPENGYGMAKLCAGQMSRIECEKYNIDHIWTRILSVYGPYDGENSMVSYVARCLLEGKKPSLTEGDQLWDYLFADDAAEALLRMALYGRNQAVYPLGSGQSRHLREHIEIMRDVINPGLDIGFGEVPYGERQVMHLVADISKLTADTGFVPAVDYETGIRRTIEWIREDAENE